VQLFAGWILRSNRTASVISFGMMDEEQKAVVAVNSSDDKPQENPVEVSENGPALGMLISYFINLLLLYFV
jgi:hypothetical protein